MSILNPINFVTGTLGSGKSYFAMKYIMRYLADGKHVATNFDLVGDWWNTARKMSRSGKHLSDYEAAAWSSDCRSRALRYDQMDDLYDYRLPGSGEDRGLLVFDEGGLNLNTRLYSVRQKRDKDIHDNPIKTLQFYINMRKLGWTCLILSHSQEQLDNQVQMMGGSIVRLRNFQRVKLPVLGISLAKHPRFLAIHYWPEVRAITKRELYGLNTSIARHYQSMDLFEYQPESRGLRYHRDPGPLGVLVGGSADAGEPEPAGQATTGGRSRTGRRRLPDDAGDAQRGNRRFGRAVLVAPPETVLEHRESSSR